MNVPHIYATFVETRREGITKNVEGLVQALQRRTNGIRLEAPQVRLRDLNHRMTHIRKGREAERIVAKALEDPRTELVHYHVSFAAMGRFGAPVSRRNRKRPIVYHLWNAYYRPGDTFGNPPTKDLLYHRLFNGASQARSAYSRADAFVVSSRFQAEQLRTLGLQQPIHVVPNGVNVDEYRPATPYEKERAREELRLTGHPVVLYYGHLSPWKGFEFFLDALPNFLRAFPDAQILVSHTSYGNRQGQLMRRLNDLGIPDRVRVIGPHHVPTLLAAADVAVVPNVAAVGTALHPNVLLECLSAGVPVIASRVGSIPEAIKEGRTGFLVRPGDAGEITERLSVVCDDDALRRRLGAAAREDVLGRFDWNVVAPQILRVYRDLAATAPRPVPTPATSPKSEAVAEAEPWSA